MKRPADEVLLAYLEETLEEEQRAEVLAQLASEPELAVELEQAAAALQALRALPSGESERERGRRTGISPWWLVVVAMATLALAFPVTLYLEGRGGGPADLEESEATGLAEFVLILRGRWAEDLQVDPDEHRDRLAALRAWTAGLVEEGILVSTSDLALEQGLRFGPSDRLVPMQPEELEYVVGVLTIRSSSYQEALAVARSCPHVTFGGTVTVRRLGGGFFTVGEAPDYTD